VPLSTPRTSEAGLPSDLEACHDLIRELAFLLESKDADIARLKERLQNMTRGKFGRSTEKLSAQQLSLFKQQLEDLLQAAGEHSAPSENSDCLDAANANTHSKKHGGGGRKPINPSVKRVPKHYFPADDELVCQCGESKKEIGTVSTDQLDYIPASFRVIEHITHKFACKKCQEGVVEGKRPNQILCGGKATEGLIAQISTAKHADHLPLYRQEQIYAREGVDVPRSSMGRWLDQSAGPLKLIVDRMHELVLQSKMVEVDESPVRFLDKNILPKKSKMGYVWVLHGDNDHPYTIFDFQPDRTAERAKAILRGYSNFLLTDGYGGYEWFDQERSANCNVHARRYFEKAVKYDKKKAGLILALYTKLFEIERHNHSLTEEELLTVRQKESIPILNQMKELLLSWQLTTPPKSTLGIAINYALPRWDKLCRFTKYGFLKLGTNLVENSIRPIALGRKNWLHIGSEVALQTASVHATLVNTCKRLDVNPYLYLRDVLIRLGQGEDNIDDLLPDHWQNQNLIDDSHTTDSAESKMATVA
jgi:transposase